MHPLIVFVRFHADNPACPGLPVTHAAVFQKHAVEHQFTEVEQAHICASALSFAAEDVEGAKALVATLRGHADTLNLMMTVQLCTKESNLQWILCSQDNGQPAFTEVGHTTNFADAVIDPHPLDEGWGVSESINERDEIVEDEPISTFTKVLYLMMLFMLLIGAPYIGYLERSGQTPPAAHEAPAVQAAEKADGGQAREC